MKFKVGDKVIAKKEAPYCITNTKMKRAEVLKAVDNEITIKILDHENKWEIGNTYWVNPKFFELVNNEPIIIYRNGDEVIALDKNTGKKGVAKCSPEDEFDFNIGAKLAFERLMNPTKIVKQSSYNVGDKVKIVDKWVDGCCQNIEGNMDKWLGKIVTIAKVNKIDYHILEDDERWYWNDACIEGKVVSDTKDEDKFKPGDIVEMTVGILGVPKGARGILVRTHRCMSNYWAVDFKVRYANTHDCGCLSSLTGLFVYDDKFKKVSE